MTLGDTSTCRVWGGLSSAPLDRKRPVVWKAGGRLENLKWLVDVGGRLKHFSFGELSTFPLFQVGNQVGEEPEGYRGIHQGHPEKLSKDNEVHRVVVFGLV